ncbi:MAG TPA: trigger factor [Desulfotomaculum sp.]|nr:trigger factor [Desulfotomaculum sp.]
MKATAERIEKNTVLLEIEVETERFSKALDQAYQKLVKKVNVPGFRRGKTPRFIFERHVGTQTLVDEAVEIVIPEAYFMAVGDTGIEPVAQPQLELVQVEEGKPVVFKAKVTVKPEVTLGQYTGLEAPKPDISIGDEDVDKELNRLQQMHARLITIEEGEVENGDLLTIDFLGKIEGIPFEGGEGKDYNLEIGSHAFIAGMEEGMIGMKQDETKDIEVTFPADYRKEDLAGKDAVFTVTVKEIKRKELAPIDDDFAKDVSEFENLDELKANIRNKLEQASKTRSDAIFKQTLISKAVENSQMEIPDEMLQGRIDEMAEDIERNLWTQGVSIQDYLSYTGSTVEEMRKQFSPEAEKSLKRTLVLEAIAKAEKLEPSEDEIEAEIEKIGREIGQSTEMIRKTVEEKGRGKLVEQIRINKAIDFIISQAKIVEPAEEKEEQESKPEQE